MSLGLQHLAQAPLSVAQAGGGGGGMGGIFFSFFSFYNFSIFPLSHIAILPIDNLPFCHFAIRKDHHLALSLFKPFWDIPFL